MRLQPGRDATCSPIEIGERHNLFFVLAVDEKPEADIEAAYVGPVSNQLDHGLRTETEAWQRVVMHWFTRSQIVISRMQLDATAVLAITNTSGGPHEFRVLNLGTLSSSRRYRLI
jgi:hypothetical protein